MADVRRNEVLQAGETLAIGMAGGVLFWLLALPAPWLLGAMLPVAAAALVGRPAAVPRPIRDIAFLLLGVSMGGGLSPETLAAASRWPLSIAALLASVPLIVAAAASVLVGIFGWERRAAMLAVVPGALSYVLAIATSLSLDVRRITIAQTLRLVLIVTLLPLAFGGGASGVPPASMPPPADARTLVLLVGAGFGGGLLAMWLALPAPFLIGGLLTSGALHASGLVVSGLPGSVLVPALVVTGAGIGSRFAGTSVAELKAILGAAIAAFAVTSAIAAGVALAVAWGLGIPVVQTLLAFSPGGLEASIVLAFLLDLDPAFVATHQLVRFVGIALLLPLVFRRVATDAG